MAGRSGARHESQRRHMPAGPECQPDTQAMDPQAIPSACPFGSRHGSDQESPDGRLFSALTLLAAVVVATIQIVATIPYLPGEAPRETATAFHPEISAMTRRPEIAVLISSYERPYHLRRCLVSIAQQQDVDGLVEVVVTDDGSIGPNRSVVATFEREVDFPVKHTTHVHDGFRLARCRNEGVAVSTAPSSCLRTATA